MNDDRSVGTAAKTIWLAIAVVLVALLGFAVYSSRQEPVAQRGASGALTPGSPALDPKGSAPR